MRQNLFAIGMAAIALAMAGCKIPPTVARHDIAYSPRMSDSKQRFAFSAYDAEFVKTIENHWLELLDTVNGKLPAGKVVLTFRLHDNGTISEMKVVENTAGEIASGISQRAIMEYAPYKSWPPRMRKSLRETYREVTFRFYYN